MGDKTTPEETPAQRAARLAAAAQPEESGIASFLKNVVDFFGNLLKAIFGAFGDKDSEYSLIDRAHAQQTGWGENGAERAQAFITSVGNGKLRELAAQYQGQKLVDISPFKVKATITSHLGHREVEVGSSDHKGIDMVPMTVSGRTYIHNTMPGVVIRSETQRNEKGEIAGFGHWVEVACIDGTRRRYAHLEQQGVKIGTVLHQGDVIGIMGNSGTGSGAHLHYEWRDADGKLLEPRINNAIYARNDRSYRQSTVLPAEASVYSGNGQNKALASLVNRESLPKLATQNGGTPSPLAFASASTVIGSAKLL